MLEQPHCHVIHPNYSKKKQLTVANCLQFSQATPLYSFHFLSHLLKSPLIHLCHKRGCAGMFFHCDAKSTASLDISKTSEMPLWWMGWTETEFFWWWYRMSSMEILWKWIKDGQLSQLHIIFMFCPSDKQCISRRCQMRFLISVNTGSPRFGQVNIFALLASYKILKSTQALCFSFMWRTAGCTHTQRR